MSLSHSASSPRPEKRAPTTPLALSKLHNKRQFTTKPLPARSPLKAFPVALEMLETRRDMWLLEKQLTEERGLREFLELERKLAAET